MFDIGFAELLVIAVVSLIVLGPQRLPETVRFVGLWVGRLRRGLSAARRELEQEMGVDEIRRQLHNEDILRSLGETKKNLESLTRADIPGATRSPSPAASESNAPDADPDENAPGSPEPPQNRR